MEAETMVGLASETMVGGLQPTALDGIRAPSFPRRRESSLVGTETYRIKRFLQPYALDSRFHGNDEECENDGS
ncbi:TPA: hypothetical protein ACLBJJ_001303 [Neisseria meningitidis]